MLSNRFICLRISLTFGNSLSSHCVEHSNSLKLTQIQWQSLFTSFCRSWRTSSYTSWQLLSLCFSTDYFPMRRCCFVSRRLECNSNHLLQKLSLGSISHLPQNQTNPTIRRFVKNCDKFTRCVVGGDSHAWINSFNAWKKLSCGLFKMRTHYSFVKNNLPTRTEAPIILNW